MPSVEPALRPLPAAFDPQHVLAALRRVLPDDGRPVPLHEPTFGGREWDYVKECLDSGWVSSVGAYVDRFEAMLADIAGVRHAVAVVNGTAALHTCLLVLGVGPGDEVLVPTLTFVATTNAVAHAGAVPHLIDAEERTLGVDPAKLADHLAAVAERTVDGCRNRRTGRRIAAVMPMHVFGHPVDMDPLSEVAARHGVPVIEDAAEAVGSRYKGRPAGSLGRLAAFSFNGNKTFTTGGGGAVLTDDADLARAAKHLTTTARVPHRWGFLHDRVGYNYRLPNLNAALGCAQLEQAPVFLAAKRRLAAAYQAAFAVVPGVRLFREAAFAKSNHWLNALLLDEAVAAQRDALLALTNDAGIMTRPVWTLMHRLPMFADCPRADLSVAENLEARIVNLPSGAALAERLDAA